MTETVVITGASAGIGRATARLFAESGARVGLIARGAEGLRGAEEDVTAAGGTAHGVVADIADFGQVDAAATRIEEELGPIDVWVNVAFTSVFAPFAEITPEEFRRVTEVTYLGFVHGTMAALARMRPRDHGVIVQVGSALGERSIPLQSAYCGAKHAINGFTSSLRCELLHERSAVRVTVVQMPAVNTPQFSWVRSRLPRRPQPVPPIYQPEVAARGVVRAAGHPGRRQYLVARAPRRPCWPTGWCPRCLTGTWPAPATTPSRPASASPRTSRATCGSRRIRRQEPTTARTANSTTGRTPEAGLPQVHDLVGAHQFQHPRHRRLRVQQGQRPAPSPQFLGGVHQDAHGAAVGEAQLRDVDQHAGRPAGELAVQRAAQPHGALVVGLAGYYDHGLDAGNLHRHLEHAHD
jgi:NAD(P)-dependent dehydrogenase (short-subunit alcohol dehydrogenase family)